MRIVLDTNILARANPNSKGVARILLLTILESAEHVLVLSPFLLRETERVLSYPRLQAIWPLTPVEIEQYTQALQDFAELVNPQSSGIFGCTAESDAFVPGGLRFTFTALAVFPGTLGRE